MIDWFFKLFSRRKKTKVSESYADVLMKYGFSKEKALKWERQLPLRIRKAEIEVELEKINKELEK